MTDGVELVDGAMVCMMITHIQGGTLEACVPSVKEKLCCRA